MRKSNKNLTNKRLGVFISIVALTGYLGSPLLRTADASPPTPSNLVEGQKILEPIVGGTTEFGRSTATSGNTMITSAGLDDTNGTDAGAAYVFVNNGSGAWVDQAKLIASDGAPGDLFGLSVALDGDTAIVGAHYDDSQTGSAYIFVRDGSGVWTEQAKLVASDGVPGDRIGIEVQIDGDTAVISSQYADGSLQGSAYVFVRNAGVWTEQAKLIASDRSANDRFGAFTSVENDTVVVSAHTNNDNGAESGSIYIFERSGSVWTETQKLLASDGVTWAQFGTAPIIDSDTIVVGANADSNANGQFSGAAYVFEKNGGTWSETAKLIASDGAASDRYGVSVALEGDTAVIGSYGDDDNGSWSGSAYIYYRNAGSWGNEQKLIASDGAANDWFGFAPAISGDTVLIGTPADDNSNGTNAGSIYVFGMPAFTVTKTADTNDGVCDSDCSLREAIVAANAASSDDLIKFSSLFDTPQTITLNGTVLTMANNGKATIEGPGADLLTVSGDNLSRVFYINSGAQVEINGLAISNGQGPSAPAQYGGGLYNNGGDVTLNDSAVRGNSSVNTGGGMAVEFNGKMTLNNSIVSGNTSTNGGGGGIYSNRSELTLNNSTVSGNSALFSGGGIFIDSDISGGPVTLSNSTVTNNSGSNSGGMVSFRGANIPNIGNTIIAGNNAPVNTDVSGSFNSLGYNLIGVTDGSSGFGVVGDLTGSAAVPLDPKLGPLQDNGGPTSTHALLGGSPALNAGSNALIPGGVSNDQRGSGFPRISNSIVDIGAYESDLNNSAPSISSPGISLGAGSSGNVAVGVVSDAEDADENLIVTFDGGSSSSENGVSVSNLAVDLLGNITADLSATCGASNADFSLNVADSGGLSAAATLSVSVSAETEAPVIDPISDVVAYLPPGSTATSMVVSFANPTASDNCSTPVVTATPVSGSLFPVGETTVTVDAVDDAGNNAESVTFAVRVLYNFAGFFSPIDNMELNNVKAGRGIPIKFSLSGDKGLNILAAGYPASYSIPCGGSGEDGEEIPTVIAGNSSLSYDAVEDQYNYVWKTDKGWKNTCRRLVVQLNDGSVHTADFKFK